MEFAFLVLAEIVALFWGYVLGIKRGDKDFKRAISAQGFFKLSDTERIVGRIERLEWPEGK